MKREIKAVGLANAPCFVGGVHLLGEWYGCQGVLALLEDANKLRQICLYAAEEAGLTIVGDRFHQFAPAGVTGTVLLAESHLAVHTWPEVMTATVDVFICNHTRDNRARAQAVYAALRDTLAPAKENFLQINRGGLVGGEMQ